MIFAIFGCFFVFLAIYTKKASFVRKEALCICTYIRNAHARMYVRVDQYFVIPSWRISAPPCVPSTTGFCAT